MSEFFNGWRPKVGVVTLFLACVFLGGWVRSLVVKDRILFSDITGSNSVFCGIIGLETSRHSLDLLTFQVDTATPMLATPIPPGVVPLKVLSFRIGPLLAIPFWSIVIPLTLVSAFLLLCKPGIANLKRFTDSLFAESI